MKRLTGAVIGLLCLAAPAAAETPAAIVEDVQGKVEGVEFMDYVAPGKIIKLGPTGTLVLGYLKSCWRETITGGVVQVGPDQSAVQLGDVQRVKVPCDANAAQLSEREANQSAATTFRTMKSDKQGAAPKKLTTLYGVAPLVEAKSGGTLAIERIDAKGEQFTVPLTGNIMVRGKFYDFAKAGKTLTPGGTYLATLGTHRFTFQVDAKATTSPTPIVGRLLRLE
ncbi:hypothetical protein JQ596_31580 [Bradyrhizobium manausense]|uniref:hypothetical protein n=1 Tax=Bradyrhizobium TaxID=374 RepID=UPI001BA5F047|nr:MULTISPECIES: hypothetical protein [Bradyrhizobium]MBR0830079.1 hypothetical protein [Bradyrhizobium manausense]UVO30943.1 hypothetical protein KUF59_10020 [Bradyrhizobium arachidis]